MMQLSDSGHAYTHTPYACPSACFGLGFPQQLLATLEKPSKIYHNPESSRTFFCSPRAACQAHWASRNWSRLNTAGNPTTLTQVSQYCQGYKQQVFKIATQRVLLSPRKQRKCRLHGCARRTILSISQILLERDIILILL